MFRPLLFQSILFITASWRNAVKSLLSPCLETPLQLDFVNVPVEVQNRGGTIL